MADHKERHGKHTILKAALYAILFVIDTLLFDGLGRISKLFFTTLQTIGLLLSARSGEFAAGASNGTILLQSVVYLLVNIFLYYILATVITALFIFVMRRKEKV